MERDLKGVQVKIKLVLLSLLFSLNTQISVARSPAVLPMVEIVPEQKLQKDMKNAKGYDFTDQSAKAVVPQVDKRHPNSFLDGLLFFLTLLLPGVLTTIILRKAHKIPVENESLPDNVIPLRKENQEKISKAS